MTKIKLLTDDMNSNPHLYFRDEFVLIRKNHENEHYEYKFEWKTNCLCIWIANGFCFYGVHEPEIETFSFLEKLKFHFAFMKWNSINNKKIKEKSIIFNFIDKYGSLRELEGIK